MHGMNLTFLDSAKVDGMRQENKKQIMASYYSGGTDPEYRYAAVVFVLSSIQKYVLNFTLINNRVLKVLKQGIKVTNTHCR